MKTTLLALATLALLSGAAMAGTTHQDATICTPSTGNWVNAATQTCPPLSNGGDLTSETRVRYSPPAHECPKSDTKRS